MTCSLCAEPQRYQSCQRQFQHSLLVCSGATSADFRRHEGRIKEKKKLVCIQKCCRVIQMNKCWPAFLKHSPHSYHPLHGLTHAASRDPGWCMPQHRLSRWIWPRGPLLLLMAGAGGTEGSSPPKGNFWSWQKKEKKRRIFFPLQYVMGISSSQSSGHSTSLSNWAGCWWALGEPPPPHTSSQGLPAGSWAWRGGPLSSPGCHTPAASGSNGPPQAHHRRSFSKRTEEPAQTFCSWARPAPLTSINSSHGNLIL